MIIMENPTKKKGKIKVARHKKRWMPASLANEGDGFVELTGLNRLYEANVTCYHDDVVQPPPLQLVELTTLPVVDAQPSNMSSHPAIFPFESDFRLICVTEEL